MFKAVDVKGRYPLFMFESNKLTITLPDSLRIKERARKVLALRFEHPDWSQGQIGNELGITSQRVSYILNHPRVLEILPVIARQKISSMVPKATQRLGELMVQSENLEVARKVTERVLTDKKALDAPETKISTEITFKTLQSMQEMVQRAAALPQLAIDADIVADPSTITTQPE